MLLVWDDVKRRGRPTGRSMIDAIFCLSITKRQTRLPTTWCSPHDLFCSTQRGSFYPAPDVTHVLLDAFFFPNAQPRPTHAAMDEPACRLDGAARAFDGIPPWRLQDRPAGWGWGWEPPPPLSVNSLPQPPGVATRDASRMGSSSVSDEERETGEREVSGKRESRARLCAVHSGSSRDTRRRRVSAARCRDRS